MYKRQVVDPKNFSNQSFVDRKTNICVIPPNSFALARTVEYFKIPRNIMVICLGKSTYARCGIIVNVTPLEPEWEGHVTLEFSNESFVDRKTDVCVIPPNSFVLASTVEYFKIPRNIMVICLGKSTYARCGIIVNVTPLEPEWEGHVTLEFSNTTPLPAKIYANEGACQFLFLKGDTDCETSYADRKGKYQGQQGVTLPKL